MPEPEAASLPAEIERRLAAVALPRPGVVYPAWRRAPGDRSTAPLPPVPEAPAPVTRIAPEGEEGSDRRVEPMTWHVMVATADHLDGGEAGAALPGTLERWAVAGALGELAPAGPAGGLARSRYTLKRALLPLIVSHAVLHRDLAIPPARLARIEAWLARLVALAEPADGPVTARNNHRYMRDAVLVAWGALTGDLASFRAGVRGALGAIAAMGADGGWPLELARGRRALWYQRHALASLVAAAEIAHGQGLDLYAPAPDGRGLHRAVTFLLNGIDAARAGRLADQDLGFFARRGNGRHYMAWAEAYVARFPAEPGAARLRRLLAGAPRPLIDDYSGGDVARLIATGPGAA